MKTPDYYMANISHKIRIPMNAIIGMSELLLTGKNLDEEQLHQVRNIHTSATFVIDIINDIQDYSKIQADKLCLVPGYYDFHLVIDNINSMVRFLAGNKGIAFDLFRDGEIPKYLYGDDIRLRQVLLNILSNAVKFTEKGQVTLTISVTDTSIHFEISDTGIGIREDDIPLLFTAFTQTDTQKNHGEGTGLGLAISKSVVEMMGGSITVESVYGEGTTFYITIPKVLGDETLSAEPIDQSNKNEDPDEFRISIEQMEGLSVKTGLGRISGWDAYKTSLRLMIKEIEACDMNLKDFLEAGDLRNFSITVHGMKSALAFIGAMELSDMAYDLEQASGRNDADFCASNLPPFLKRLTAFSRNLAEAFSKDNLNRGPIEIPPILPLIFERLKAAFDETDFLGIDEGIESLDALNLSGALKDEIERLKGAVLIMDYEGAREIMRKLII